MNGKPDNGAEEFRARCRRVMDEEGWDALEGLARHPRADVHNKARRLLRIYGHNRPPSKANAAPRVTDNVTGKVE